MKLLVDANLSPRIATWLADVGYDASHVVDHGLLAASDEKIASFAVSGGYAIVSADSDFATMLAFSGHTAPSLVLMRSVDRQTPAEQAQLLIANLPAVLDDLQAGAVVSFARGHLRVRRLPLRG
jgi:predicted nuclease of predicted toxin-antitoxin system